MGKSRGVTIAAMGLVLIAASCAEGDADGTTLPIVPPPPVVPPPAPVPLTLTVSPAAHRTTVQAGQNAAPAAVTITIAGDGSDSAPWIAVARSNRTVVDGPAGTGSGLLHWTRQVA